MDWKVPDFVRIKAIVLFLLDIGLHLLDIGLVTVYYDRQVWLAPCILAQPAENQIHQATSIKGLHFV
jgi:hypothetical protein